MLLKGSFPCEVVTGTQKTENNQLADIWLLCITFWENVECGGVSFIVNEIIGSGHDLSRFLRFCRVLF